MVAENAKVVRKKNQKIIIHRIEKLIPIPQIESVLLVMVVVFVPLVAVVQGCVRIVIV